MSAFVNLRPISRLAYVNLSAGEGVTSEVNIKNHALDVRGPAWVKDAAVEVVEANQSFELRLGTIAPRGNYTLMLVVHHALQNSTVGPTVIMLEPGEVLDCTLNFRALRKINLTEMPHCVRLYLID